MESAGVNWRKNFEESENLNNNYLPSNAASIFSSPYFIRILTKNETKESNTTIGHSYPQHAIGETIKHFSSIQIKKKKKKKH
jgi:hypothetical protein